MKLKSIVKLCSTLLIIFSLYSCGIGFQYTTLNHVGHIDGIYSSKDFTIDTLSEFQFRNKLRTDFNFRYNFAQYALRQPNSFDWNNPVLGNRYNNYHPYWGYSLHWDRAQMWNDWVWGYNYLTPYRWSPFGYGRWGYNNYGWNNYYGWNTHYGWNNYYGWGNYGQNTWYGRRGRSNVSYINGRRGTTIVTQDRVRQSSKHRTNTNTRPRVNNNRPVINNRPNNNIRPVRTNNIRPVRTNNNIRPIRTNNNTRPVRTNNNTRPIRKKSNRKSN